MDNKERGKKGLTGEGISGEGSQRVDDGESPMVDGGEEVVDGVQKNMANPIVRSNHRFVSRNDAENSLELRRAEAASGWRRCAHSTAGLDQEKASAGAQKRGKERDAGEVAWGISTVLELAKYANSTGGSSELIRLPGVF
jgi:hypothetical protein